ncbi:MAG TPA: Uma2 family endonuclease [Thermoanaerobaculia bacterium]|nr:Uma2 family endonuclease [Thermoanaerobaculia bacterium]
MPKSRYQVPAGQGPLIPLSGNDPNPYGSRWVHLPDGGLDAIRLTPEDLLDSNPMDQIGQSQVHWEFLFRLSDIIYYFYDLRDDVMLTVRSKILWRIPGLPEPAPDIAITQGLREIYEWDSESFDPARAGVWPCLIIEVATAFEEEVRSNDYEKKVDIYEKAGVPEYMIFEPSVGRHQGPLLLTGYRLGPDGQYQWIEPDSQGRLLSETTGLLFGVEEDGRTLLAIDTRTGERLLSPMEKLLRAKAARIAAEEQLARDIEARKAAEERAARAMDAQRLADEGRKAAEEREKAAEAEIARLRAELDKARNTDR